MEKYIWVGVIGILGGLLFKVFLYWRVLKKPTLFYGSKESENVCHNCPSLNRLYYPFFLHGGQLGFSLIYNYLMLQKIHWISEIYTMEDGQKIRVDWVDSLLEDSPILMILPGGMCDSSNMPGQGWVLEAQKRGWAICCYHPRGTHCPLIVPKINLFGSTQDIRYIINHYIKKRRPHSNIYVVGISCGSGLLVRFLGEEGEHSLITAAVALCPGYDIRVCMNRSYNPYRDYLTQGVKNFYLKPHQELFREVDGYDACLQAKDTQEFLDNAYVMAGYNSSEQYYQYCNPMDVISQVKTPCLLINSKDDPICIYRNVEENIFHIKDSSHLVLVTTETGNHCVFWEGFSMKSWAERVAFEFFDAC
jgi:hypothetical protein